MDYINNAKLKNYIKLQSLLKSKNLFSENKSLEEYQYQDEETLEWLCECSKGHRFDYRKRKRYLIGDKAHAPCEGMCPVCGDSKIAMWSLMIYPIKMNYL